MRLRRLHRSLTFRLALLSLALFSAAIALLLAIAWAASIQTPISNLQRQLAVEAQQAQAAYARGGMTEAVRVLEARSELPAQPYFAILDPRGRRIAGTRFDDVEPFAEGWTRLEFDEWDGRGDDDAIARVVTLAPGVVALVARDIEVITDREGLMAEAIGWSCLIAPTLGLLFGLLMSIAVGRRVDSVIGAARQVMAGDLSGRVPVQGTGDDFDQLAQTLNLMLARIEALVQSVSTVSDQIAHELRTPLTRLRAEIEDLADTATEPMAAARAHAALAEAERLQSIFDALLRIARLESGRHVIAARPVDLGHLVEDAAGLYRPEAEARGVVLEAESAPGIMIQGDPDLLFQALCNLVDNAVKFSAPGGHVQLRAARQADAFVVSVTDDGSGIPAELHGPVFDRFFRGPKHRGTDGLGLGLPLVAAVCRAHGGRVDLSDLSPGLEATIRLPAPQVA